MTRLRNKNELTEDEWREIRRLALASHYNDEIFAFADKSQIGRITVHRLAMEERRKAGFINIQKVSDSHRKDIETIALQERGYRGVEDYAKQHDIKIRTAKDIAFKSLKKAGIKVSKTIDPYIRTEIQKLSLLSPTNEKIYEYANKHGVSISAAQKIASMHRRKFGCQKTMRPPIDSKHEQIIRELALQGPLNKEIYAYAQQHDIPSWTVEKYATRARREAGKLRKNRFTSLIHRKKIQELAQKYQSYVPIKEYAKRHKIKYSTAKNIARTALMPVISEGDKFSGISPPPRKQRRIISEEERQHIKKLALERPTNEMVLKFAEEVGINKNTAKKIAYQMRKRHGVELKQNKVSLKDRQIIEQMAIEQNSNQDIYKYTKKHSIKRGTAKCIANRARSRVRKEPDERSRSLPKEVKDKIRSLTLQGRSNTEIQEDIKKGGALRYARRYRALFGISRFMTDEQRETIKRLALQDRDNRIIYLYTEREGVNKGTVRRYAARVRREHKDAAQEDVDVEL